MAYKIVNGPTVMSCAADPIVTANFKFVYDDAEASTKELEVAVDDIIRVKYMGGEYSPVVLEATGRLDRFSVLKNKNGRVFASDAITDTLGEVKTIVVDTSSENNTQTVSIPVAAIRELEIVRYADGTYPGNNTTGTKPDCAAPGTNCPLNPDCLCPSYKEPERVPCDCKPEKEGIDFDGDKVIDAYIDDSGLLQGQIEAWKDAGYVCVFKGTPYKRLQDAINNVVCPCVDTIQDAIIIFNDIKRPEGCKDVNYIVTGPCIIRSLTKSHTAIVEGSFTINSPEMVILYNLEIWHSGVGKEVVAIDSVNASVSVQKCIIGLDKNYKLPEETTESTQLPMSIRVCRLATSGKSYENVFIKDNVFVGYHDFDLNDARSTAICLTRNFGEVYGDFPYIIEGNSAEGMARPHILFSDQNFNGGTDDSTLECSGLVYTKEGLRDMLKYQGADTYICNKGIIDLDIEQFAISIATEARLVNEGILNLGTNIMTNYGKFCNSGIVTGGTIINNGELTICAGMNEQWVDFYNTKVRTNGAQKALKGHMLKNEAKEERLS